jgi:hypothetical protein
MKIVVIGGGFIGQLVQWAVPRAEVFDWRKVAPANHLETRIGPQYLWEPIPGMKTTEFEVETLVDGRPPEADRILRYKRKIGKESDGGNWGLQFTHKMKGYAPHLPVPRIKYAMTAKVVRAADGLVEMENGDIELFDTLVSTIPLPSFLKMLDFGDRYTLNFKFDPIFMRVERATEFVNGMVLNYISNPQDPWYRITRAGHDTYFESLRPMPGCKKIIPGKIHAHPDTEKILATLAYYKIYCFGRFAAWRPDELAHETWQNIATWRSCELA